MPYAGTEPIDKGDGRKILVIGDIILDQYLTGYANRLCPEAPVPIVAIEDEKWYLGGAANVAVNIRAMGGQVLLAGVVGQDMEGNSIKKMLKAQDIPLVLRIDASRPTTVKKRILAQDHLLLRVDRESCTDILEGTFQDIVTIITAMPDIAMVVISDYRKGVVTEALMEMVRHLCQHRQIPVYVNPRGNNYRMYKGVEIISPTLDALEIFYGQDICSIDALEDAVRSIFLVTQCNTCIVTLETNGVIYFRGPSDWVHYPWQRQMDGRSATGAEGVFLAALVMGIERGLNPEKACEVANRVTLASKRLIGTMVATKESFEEVCSEY